jgi:BirA family biotin operon repressor/biotin-[acetyl-CoA-carboxylase] ligase
MIESNRFDLARLRQQLKPFRVHYFPTVGSTSAHAAKMRKEKRLFAPAIVLTSRQTAGRGRGSNQWFSADGSLTVTFVLPIDEHEPWQLPLIAGLAARAACAEVSGHQGIMLKWPNDLLAGGKKLAGLLCQRIEKADLVGIGINVNTPIGRAPRELRGKIISLERLAGRPVDINEVLIKLAEHLRRVVRLRNEKPFAAFVEEYQKYDALAGERVQIAGENGEPAISGICQGIDDSGRLVLQCRDKVKRIIAGHVIFEGQ